MRTHITVIAMTIACSSMAACATQARSPEPVPVDRVECARCRMLISTETGSAQIVPARGDTRFYDDLGCLAADWAAHQGEATAFVRTGQAWFDAGAASFAQPPAARTAMGSGFVAFARPEDARAADRAGRALGWDDVVRLVKEMS